MTCWEKWLKDCRKELEEKGHDPNEWEIAEDGTIYYVHNRFVYIKNAVTPWKDYVENL